MTVEAGYSKHRREDRQPIQAELAAKLAKHLKGKQNDAPAFNLPSNFKDYSAKMLKADLDAAREAWLKEAAKRPGRIQATDRERFPALL